MHEHNNSHTDEELTPLAGNDNAETGETGSREQNQELEQLQQKISELEQEKEDLNKRLLRLQADFDNYRKRSRAEKEDLSNYALFELLQRLLPVIDNLDRACVSAENNPDSVVEGVNLIARQLKELLGKEGLKEIECKGKPFDPQCHDAVLSEESGEHPPNTVVDELQRGYMMKDRVLRPSMVKVAVEKTDE